MPRRRPAATHPALLLDHQPWCACLADPTLIECDCGAIPRLNAKQVEFLRFNAEGETPHYWELIDSEGCQAKPWSVDRLRTRKREGAGLRTLIVPVEDINPLKAAALVHSTADNVFALTPLGQRVLAAVLARKAAA